MRHWLFKSEPTAFNIDDLKRRPKQTTDWDGVRNYQARNMLRDEIKVGDLVFFYHSNCHPPGIAGIMKVVEAGHPDLTAQDPTADHFDPKSSSKNPIWYQVSVQFIEEFPRIFSLNEIKQHPMLKQMLVARTGNRLSITAVTEQEWETIRAIRHATQR